MAIFVRKDRDSMLTPAAHCVVGRSSACAVRLDDSRVSGEHAAISWRDGRWHVRDLGSRNGTFVNGARLERGAGAKLGAGDEVAFGHSELCYRVMDDSPPVAAARLLDTGVVTPARNDMLVLPSEDAPALCVYEDANGHWVIEQGGEAHECHDGEIVWVAGHGYMLHLPVALARTVDVREQAADVGDVALTFRVSRNEEQVEVFVDTGGATQVIEPRAHHYTWLTLARLRLEDEGNAALPASSRGWRSVDELCRLLATDENKLNVEIYRIRRDMAATGVVNPAAVVERRRGTRLLRLGTGRVAIMPLAGA